MDDLLEHVEGLLEEGYGRSIFGHGQMNSQQHLFGGHVVDQGVRQGHRRQPVGHAVAREQPAAQQLPRRYAHHRFHSKNKKLRILKKSSRIHKRIPINPQKSIEEMAVTLGC